MKAFFLTIFSLLFLSLYAQEGDYFLSHHVPPDGTIDHINFDIQQDDDGIMWIANRKGVVQYDGKNWHLIPTPSAIFQVIPTPYGIYASGRNLIGKIEKTQSRLKFQSLYESDSIDDMFSMILVNEALYFLSEHRVMIIHPGSDTLVSSIYRRDLDFVDVFQYKNMVILTTEKNGNFKLTEDLSSIAPFTDLDQIGFLVSLESNDENNYAAINSDGQLFYVHERIDSINIEDNAYLRNTNPTSLLWVDNELIAVSTLSGGVIFINRSTSDYKITDYFSGLPENQIFAMTKDSQNAIWVSHDFGFSRITPLLPVRNYTSIPGIEGNILSIRDYRGQIYAGTSVGVYTLKEIPVYTETISYERVRSKSKIAETNKKSKKGLFGFLKKQKTKSSPKSQSSFVKKIHRELKSIQYAFYKVSSIKEETNQFIPLQSGLLAAGISGIYEINDTTSNEITNTPVRFIHYSPNNKMLTASTYDNRILTFKKAKGKWIKSDVLDGLEDFVSHITESGNAMWLSGADSIYRVELTSGFVTDVDVFQIDNPYFDKTYAIEHEGRMLFINNSGFTYYDEEKRQMLFDSVLTKTIGVPQRIFIGNDQSAWIFSGEKWHTLGSDLPVLDLKFLNAFPNIRQLEYTPKDSTYWVITFSNDIYGVKPIKDPVGSIYNVLLKEISNNDLPLNYEASFDVQQDDNNLVFRFIQPDYSGMLGVEYRYRLNGLNNQWSAWSVSNNNLTFSYLPPGKYQLELETKTALGRVDSHKKIEFKIVPPYWRQPWFYALEVLLFSTLLILSIRLNRGARKYGILSRLLAFLTLILIVEFVQTIAEYKFETDNSPVIDFFIQVSIALLVLPVESLLRRAIFKKDQIENSLKPDKK